MKVNTSLTSKSGILTIIIMVVIVVAACSYFFLRDKSVVQKRNNTPAAKALLVDTEAQSFTDVQGNKVSVSQEFGKPMVVMSWASWCPQCTQDLKELGTIAQEFSGKGVVVLAINRAEDKYSAERYLTTLELPKELTIILDPTDHYFGNSDGYAMPETIIFAPDGSKLTHQHGEVRTQEIKDALEKLLKE